MAFRTDQALWYNVGVWGELGYAVPNFGDDTETLNSGIHYLTEVMARNLSAVMHHPDVDLRTPPSINTLIRVHKLVNRARSILAARAVASGTPNMEPAHSSPAPEVFIIYPVPYFKVRNKWLKEWCGLILNALCEAYQHTENRKAFEISEEFASRIGQYIRRVYKLMATELFNVPLEEAVKDTFVLTDAQLAAYNPSAFFTSTELIDVVPTLSLVPTEDDLQFLTSGIPATMLLNLQRYPGGQPPAGDVNMNGAAATASPGPAKFPAAPSP